MTRTAFIFLFSAIMFLPTARAAEEETEDSSAFEDLVDRSAGGAGGRKKPKAPTYQQCFDSCMEAGDNYSVAAAWDLPWRYT